MGFPQARVMDMHACFLPTTPPPPIVPVPIPIAPPCAVTVLVGKLPAARMTDMTMSVPPHPILKGSATVIIQGLPAARVTDSCLCGGLIVKGDFTVLTGG
jgi:uncharacterized Zn-binding protein involved in type VI secretion